MKRNIQIGLLLGFMFNFLLNNNLRGQEVWSACDPDSIFTFCETPPTENNGVPSLITKINNELSGFEDIQGKIQIEFIVNCNGEIGGLEALQSLGYSFDREFMRLLKKHSNWAAGLNQQIPVDSYFSLTFRIENGQIN